MKVIDLHCDTIMALFNDRSKNLLSNDLHLDLMKMKQGDYLLQCFAMFVPLNKVDDPFDTCLRMIDLYYEELKKNEDLIRPVYSYKDIEENIKDGVMSALLTVEEGGVVKGKLEYLRTLYRLGVRLITLNWNYVNGIGHPNILINEEGSYDFKTCNTKDGLTDFGIEMVRMMNELGMIIDVSHLSDKGFYDVAKYSKGPFIASHSNARSVCNHCRNLSDDMIKIISSRGGLIGINYCAAFLKENEEENSRIEDIIKHIKHIVKIGGIECVALGSDFDGIGGNLEIKDASYIQNLRNRLLEIGFSYNDIEKIFYQNALRLFKEVLK